MNKLLVIGIILVALLAGVGTVSAANLVSNGGFEDPAISGLYQTDMTTGLTDWTIGSGNIDLIRSYWTPFQPEQSIDLSGSLRGNISQPIPTEAGKTYKLTFYMAGNPECNALNTDPQNIKSLEVYWNNQIVGTPTFDTAGSTFAALGWTPIIISNLPAAGSPNTVTSLRFVDDSQGSDTRCGVTLDAVDVELEQPIPTPEFPSVALPAAFIIGLIGAVLFIQRTKEN